MTGVLIRRKIAHRYTEREREGRWPWGDAGRNWNDEATSQGTGEPPETRSEA